MATDDSLCVKVENARCLVLGNKSRIVISLTVFKKKRHYFNPSRYLLTYAQHKRGRAANAFHQTPPCRMASVFAFRACDRMLSLLAGSLSFRVALEEIKFLKNAVILIKVFFTAQIKLKVLADLSHLGAQSNIPKRNSEFFTLESPTLPQVRWDARGSMLWEF